MNQISLPFETDRTITAPAVLDLFAGTGGLSLGFAEAGYTVTGVDADRHSAAVFLQNRIGDHKLADLHHEQVLQPVPVVVGGPPCRPWSSVNLKRRGRHHEDHALVEHFFDHLHAIRPAAFLMENVHPLIGDATYQELVQGMRRRGYSVASEVIQYSDFGAATTRRRLFTVGFDGHGSHRAEEFFGRLRNYHRAASTVRDAIGWLDGREFGSVADHEWSAVRTINKYSERYRTGQFGWRRLSWDTPAPSFGSVSKTYVLHPSSDPDGADPRVLSVREVLSIMGFRREFRFPPKTGLSLRYRMAANAVSPIVALACARVLRAMLWDDTDQGTGETAPPR